MFKRRAEPAAPSMAPAPAPMTTPAADLDYLHCVSDDEREGYVNGEQPPPIHSSLAIALFLIVQYLNRKRAQQFGLALQVVGDLGYPLDGRRRDDACSAGGWGIHTRHDDVVTQISYRVARARGAVGFFAAIFVLELVWLWMC